MNKGTIRIEWVNYIFIGLLWIMSLFDDFEIDLWKRIVGATITTACLVFVFHAGKYYFPRISDKRSKGIELIALLIIPITVFVLQRLYFEDIEAESKRENIPEYVLLIFSLIIAIIMTSMSLLLSWIYFLIEKNKQSELAISNLTALNKESELNELKSQINPHFLFNALSNIYSIAYLGDKRTPDKIMQLSKMLRYVIYDTDNIKFINLSKEVEYLNNYIEFQKFRIKKKQNIIFNYEGYDTEAKIAPLLLQPLVENAFKHSRVAFEKNTWVNINLNTDGNEMCFRIENTISKQKKEKIKDIGGIGLENIKKRLELIYKENHKLIILEGETYQVELQIKYND